METYNYGEESPEEEQRTEDGEVSSSEEAFMQGYNEEEDVQECAECGTAIEDEHKKIVEEVDGEKHTFCSKVCAEEFKEGVGNSN